MRKIITTNWPGRIYGLQGGKKVEARHPRSIRIQIAIGLTLVLVLGSALLWLLPIMGRAASMPVTCEEFAFSTEEDFETRGPTPPDGNLIISDGDLLGPNCEVCARNNDLLTSFEVDADHNLGLDAADVVDTETFLVAFSTELDSPIAGQFVAGDLLATNGTVIPNIALTDPFQLGYDVGLDAVHFVGQKQDIITFLTDASAKSREEWLQSPEMLVGMLDRYGVDIWFSTEGTAPTVANPVFLDGDLLSAATGTIMAQNSDLLPSSVPAGIPTRGVDFGLDGAASGRDGDVQLLNFTTEILYAGDPVAFTDGDMLEYGTGAVLKTNLDLVNCLEPAANELGLDALHTAPTPPQERLFLPLLLRQFLQLFRR